MLDHGMWLRELQLIGNILDPAQPFLASKVLLAFLWYCWGNKNTPVLQKVQGHNIWAFFGASTWIPMPFGDLLTALEEPVQSPPKQFS